MRQAKIVFIILAILIQSQVISAGEPGWIMLSTAGPPPRHSPGMMYDSTRGVIVMFGGITGREREGILYGDTWE